MAKELTYEEKVENLKKKKMGHMAKYLGLQSNIGKKPGAVDYNAGGTVKKHYENLKKYED